jgi:hypothetical protein
MTRCSKAPPARPSASIWLTPTNATIADPLGAGTITDNDTAPTITSVDDPLDGGINSVTVAEGTSAVFTVALSNASSTDTIYPLVLSAGSALLTSDYTNALTFSAGVSLSGGNVTVPAGVTSFTVTVPTVNDAINEPSPETFTLAVGGVTGTGYINDNDGAPTLSVNDVTVNESRRHRQFHRHALRRLRPDHHRGLQHHRWHRHGRRRLHQRHRDPDLCSRHHRPDHLRAHHQ